MTHLDVTVEALDADSSSAVMRLSLDGTTWSDWYPITTPVMTRYIQIRALASGDDPKLKDLITKIR
jgi:hypothetical protein